MSIVGPITPGLRAIAPITPINTPFPNITPFTVRDNATYLMQIEDIIRWLDHEVYPYLTENTKTLVNEWKRLADLLVNSVNTALDDQAAKVNQALIDAMEDVENQLSAQNTEVANQLASNLEAVNTAVSNVINAHIEFTDPVMFGVLSGLESNTRTEIRRFIRSWELRGPGIDPTGVEDSLAAINATMTLAAGLGIYKFILPPGTYKTSGPLRVPDGGELEGAGRKLSIVKFSGTDARVIYLANRGNIRISNIGFEIDAGITTASAGIRLDSVNDVTLDALDITNGKHAIFLAGTGKNVKINDIHFMGDTGDYAVRHHSTDANYAGVTVTNIEVDAISKKTVASPSAIFIGGGRDHVIEYNTITSTADTGVMVTKGDNIRICHNDIDSALVSIYIGSGATNIIAEDNNISSDSDFGFHVLNTPGEVTLGNTAKIANNTITGCGKSGVYVEGFPGVTIIGNDVIDCGRKSKMNSGTPIDEVQRDGISVVPYGTNKSDRPTIIGNNVRGALMRYAIRVAANTVGAVVRGNNVDTGTSGKYNIGYPQVGPNLIETDSRRINSELLTFAKRIRTEGHKTFNSITWSAGSGGNFDIALNNVRPGDTVEIGLNGAWQAGGTQTTDATLATIVNDSPVNNVISDDAWVDNGGGKFLGWTAYLNTIDKVSGTILYTVKESDLANGAPGVFRVRLYCKQANTAETRTLFGSAGAPLVGTIRNLSA